MAIEIQDGFYVSTALPIDARMQVASQAARDAIPALVRWEGMSVYSVGDAQAYKLVGGLTNEFWIEEGSGSGTGVIVVADIAELEAIPTEDRTDGMLVYVLDSGITYQLRGGNTNDDWAEFGQPVYIITDTEASRLAIRNNVRTFGLIVFQQDTKKTYRLGAGLTNSDWEELYLDRVNQNLEVAFQLTCDEDLATWSSSVLMGGTFVKETANPLNGKASYKFTRSNSSSTAILVSPDTHIPLRFRGQINTLYFPYSYDGANDIVTARLYDNTNNAFIEGTIPLQGTNGAISIAKMGVLIPLTCESVDVVFTFNGEDSDKVLQFDDVQLTSDSTVYADLNNDSDWVDSGLTSSDFTGFGTVTNIQIQSKRAGSDLLYRGRFTSGTPTAVEARVNLKFLGGVLSSESSTLIPSIQKAGTFVYSAVAGSFTVVLIEPNVGHITFGIQSSTQIGTNKQNGSTLIAAGQSISFNARIPIKGWTASSPNIVVPTDTFSTDTAALTYAPSSQYTLASLENAPIGTFITFTYAPSSVARLQTTTAPTQTIASMNANGIQIFARAYNSGSTSQSPSTIAIQIGKGLKGYELNVYKGSGKSISGNLDYTFTSFEAIGIASRSYNEVTGILLIDAGQVASSITSHIFIFSDYSFQSNGYVTINAGKTPSLVGIPLQQTAYLKDVKPSGTEGGTFTAGAWQTRTLNTLEGDTGFVSLSGNQFTIGSGKYYIEACAPARAVERHKLKLHNISTGTDAIVGSSVRVGNIVGNMDGSSQSILEGSVTLTSPTVFEIQHRCAVTLATLGFGQASGFGVTEVYTQVKITKIS